MKEMTGVNFVFVCLKFFDLEGPAFKVFCPEDEGPADWSDRPIYNYRTAT